MKETVVFHREQPMVTDNYRALIQLIKRIRDRVGHDVTETRNPRRSRPDGKYHGWKGGILWESVPAEDIMQFLNEYQSHPAAISFNCNLMSDYIKEQNRNGDIVHWSVLIASGRGPEHDFPFGLHRLITRSWHPDFKSRNKTHDRFVIRRLVSPRDEAIDLGPEEYGKALNLAIRSWTRDPGLSRRKKEPEDPNGPSIREVRDRKRGVLVVYPLDPKEVSGLEPDVPMVSMGISFPRIEDDVKVSHRVNSVFLQQQVGFD